MERNASAYTLRNYRDDLTAFFKFAGRKPLRQISPLDVRGFLADQSTKRYTKRTITRRLSCVRSFFRLLCRDGWLSHNPYFDRLRKLHSRAKFLFGRLPGELLASPKHALPYRLHFVADGAYKALRRRRLYIVRCA